MLAVSQNVLRESRSLLCRVTRWVMLGLTLVSVNAHGAQFWVVGSYAQEPNARAEGVRLSRETGIEIFKLESVQDDQVYYRLVTGYLDSPADRSRLRAQLLGAGTPEPWKLSFDGPTPYLESLLEAFGEADERNPAMSSTAGNEAVSEEAEAALDAQLFAEITDAELLEIEEMLASFDQAERSDTDRSPNSESEGDRAERRPTSALSETRQAKVDQTEPRQWPGDSSHYNAARLNKVSNWPSPRPTP